MTQHRQDDQIRGGITRRSLWKGSLLVLSTGLRTLVRGIPGIRTGYAGTYGRVDMDTLRTPLYTVEDGAFTRRNGDRYSNRPLYCHNAQAIVLAGDRPFLLLGNLSQIAGCLMVALVRGGQGKWLHQCSSIVSRYVPGHMEWVVTDKSFGETSLEFQAAPLAKGPGLAARLRVVKPQPGDQLIWASGAATQESQSVLWKYDVTTAGRDELMKRSFIPENCRGNQVRVEDRDWVVVSPAGSDKGSMRGRSNAHQRMTVADAGAWSDPVALAASTAGDLPILCGVAPAGGEDVYWVMQAETKRSPAGQSALSNGAAAFAAGIERVEAIKKQVVVETPDPWLDIGVAASCIAVDGTYRDSMYTHAGMRWGVPLLGWRTQFGAIAYGWHENVKAEAKLCISKQVTQSDRTEAKADPKAGLSSQAPESRMFGKGRVNIYHPYHYDMQSQFFDQVHHDWRYTADAELEKILRPALELHLEYIQDCFDPAGTGIYESYCNSWPTDGQWYNGGGTAEETAYAYRGHKAALDLARRAGDVAAVERHQHMLAKLSKAFFDLLWIPAKGHVGAYREQGGLKRLHESSWLYSTFCPIDAGMLNREQAAQALYYTEWALERIQLPYGGEQCWPSNWVPSIWSVREMWPGDNYHLALAYFQTGLGADGWSLLRGTFPQQMFFGPVPGDLGHPAGATDFNDCFSMFCRTVVEGLFGYSPDLPNGIVTIAPQFPADWDHASIRTPDFSLKFQRAGNSASYRVELAGELLKAVETMDVSLPVRAGAIAGVTLNGQPAKWKTRAGFGETMVLVRVPAAKAASIEVSWREPLPVAPAPAIEGHSGDGVTLAAAGAVITGFEDPQGVLEGARIASGKIAATLSRNAGHHLVLATVRAGETEQRRLFKIKVTDAVAEAALAAKTSPAIPEGARWNCVDIAGSLNGDIRTIFQQRYLSPRPNTCSLRLAVDGYLMWQTVLDPKAKPPEIDFANVPKLLGPDGRIRTPQGVPFLWNGDRNIAFTSRWDNWPRQVTVPVGQPGGAMWFLVCGSTNPMQVRIPNAELRMEYEDAVVERLELTPPFNFWMLSPYNGVDYNYQRDGFCLPKTPPATVQLGNNCRAVALSWRLRPGVLLKSVTLETLSEEVVIGLMGLTIVNRPIMR
jgi:hypothetical protein